MKKINRIKELEREVLELKERLMLLELRGHPTINPYPVVTPNRTPKPWWGEPRITWSGENLNGH